MFAGRLADKPLSPICRISTGGCVFGSACKGAARVVCQKWVRPELSRIGLTVLLRCGTEMPERVPASVTGDNKQTQFPQGISGQRQKLCLLKEMLHKSLPSFLDVLHCCFIIVRAVLFPWAAMRSRCLRSCRGYRRPTPSYHKCIGGGGNASRNWAGLHRTLTTELRRAGAEAYLPVEMHH